MNKKQTFVNFINQTAFYFQKHFIHMKSQSISRKYTLIYYHSHSFSVFVYFNRGLYDRGLSVPCCSFWRLYGQGLFDRIPYRYIALALKNSMCLLHIDLFVSDWIIYRQGFCAWVTQTKYLLWLIVLWIAHWFFPFYDLKNMNRCNIWLIKTIQHEMNIWTHKIICQYFAAIRKVTDGFAHLLFSWIIYIEV